MIDDDLETRLRESLHAEALPTAPISLRQTLADLPVHDLQGQGRHRSGLVLFAAATLILAGLGAGALLVGVSPQPLPTKDASTATPTEQAAVPTESAAPAPVIPVGYVQFAAPGIRFAHPPDWHLSTAVDNYPTDLGLRIVGMFERGLTICPNTEGVAPQPTKPPGGCATEATAPGSLMVQIFEYEGQLPPSDGYGVPATFAGYPGWTRPEDGSDPAVLTNFVSGPDDGLYLISASVPREDLDKLQAELEATLGTLQLSSWHEAPDAIDGRVHLETNEGFSFDYPAGWTVYYPRDWSVSNHAVVIVASRPLDPCPNEACQRFATPPGTVVLDFRVGARLLEPDWTDATETVGGQPAFLQHWGPEVVTNSDEGHQWFVRLNAELGVLGISANLRGPGLQAQREAMNEIIDSVRIDAPPPGDR